jgi:hypothetical protein
MSPAQIKIAVLGPEIVNGEFHPLGFQRSESGRCPCAVRKQKPLGEFQLRRFPFDYVKIDRQFVSQVDTGGTGLISGIVTLARHYDLQVIAEGVETQSQHDGLLAAGVPYAQGYLYQRPVAESKHEANMGW